MPELPEVEILARHLGPLLRGRSIEAVQIRRAKIVRPESPHTFERRLTGARWLSVGRRAKYLVFDLAEPSGEARFQMLGHLGMTGRLYVQPRGAPLVRHAAALFRLDRHDLVFEDTRYFGRLTLDVSPLAALGPEPLEPDFTPDRFGRALSRSRQPIKVKLLDQSLVAGLGNIYASEALFCARLSPRRSARGLEPAEVRRLWRSIRAVLTEAIRRGSTVPLNWSGPGNRDRLFYYGRAPGAPADYVERLRVYDRLGLPCRRCRAPIRRLVQASRSTYYCPNCQRR